MLTCFSCCIGCCWGWSWSHYRGRGRSRCDCWSRSYHRCNSLCRSWSRCSRGFLYCRSALNTLFHNGRWVWVLYNILSTRQSGIYSLSKSIYHRRSSSHHIDVGFLVLYKLGEFYISSLLGESSAFDFHIRKPSCGCYLSRLYSYFNLIIKCFSRIGISGGSFKDSILI